MTPENLFNLFPHSWMTTRGLKAYYLFFTLGTFPPPITYFLHWVLFPHLLFIFYIGYFSPHSWMTTRCPWTWTGCTNTMKPLSRPRMVTTVPSSWEAPPPLSTPWGRGPTSVCCTWTPQKWRSASPWSYGQSRLWIL